MASARRLKFALAIATLLPGCPGDDEGDDASTAAATTESPGSTSAGTTDASTTTDPGTTTSSPTDGGTKLDVGMASASESAGSGSVDIYEACQETTDCMDGLQCVAIGMSQGSLISQCTVVGCSTGMDCPDAAGADVDCIDGPMGDRQCTIICGPEGMCPEGYDCWNPSIETSPCIP